MDERNKFELNRRIIASVHKYKRKKRIQNITIAASLVLLIGVGFKTLFFNNQVEIAGPTIKQHAKSLKVDLSTESDVKLVLSNDQEVRINEDSSEIMYSKTGETVSINNDKSVKQASENNNNPRYNTIIVPYGKQSKISLSDGSKVWLNSGTKLTYPIAFNKAKREVYLEGEAIFEVTHNEQSPFHVATIDYEVKVLGTVFNVSSYPDDGYTLTALESGSVEINLPSQKDSKKRAIKIVPGTLATFNKINRDIQTKTVDIAQYMSWRDGVFIFKKDELSYILKKVSRHYKVQITLENEGLERNTFSGTLDISKGLDDVLQIIKETTDFEYERIDKQIKINQTK